VSWYKALIAYGVALPLAIGLALWLGYVWYLFLTRNWHDDRKDKDPFR
jgi:hypothetical protein